MASSFELINYNLRPNKCVERKMMIETFQRLSLIDELTNYRYIGFGSPYFADFILIHKVLGIDDLISIEQEKGKKDRFNFNIPYSGIRIEFEKSKNVLPNLELHLKKNIVWLDYDNHLNEDAFEDIETFFSNAPSGSFFVISLSIQEEFPPLIADDEIKTKKKVKDFRLDKLHERINKDRIPNEFSDVNFDTENLRKVSIELINRKINTTIKNRSSISLAYKQVFNFVYKDGTRMLTLGGVLYDSDLEDAINKINFENLPFFRGEVESFMIDCPKLTLKEIKALDSLLPSALEKNDSGYFKDKKFNKLHIKPSDVENYAKIYRYYPNYSEISL